MNKHRPTSTTIAVMAWWKAREYSLANEWSLEKKATELGIRVSTFRRIVRNAWARERAEARRIVEAIEREKDRARYAAQRCLERALEIERKRA